MERETPSSLAGKGAGGLGKVGEVHLRETELARFDEGEAGVGVAKHLRWCARCRSIVADYRWLQQEIAATLALAAHAVPVPRPKWRAVRERMIVSRRHQMRWYASAAASVMLTVCLVLFVPNFLGLAVVAQMPQPEAVMPPAPVTAVVSGEHPVSGATPTPAISCAEAKSLQTPVFVLPPTPPESGT